MGNALWGSTEAGYTICLSFSEKKWPHSLPERYFTGRANLFVEDQER
jgi:hypothetical protein